MKFCDFFSLCNLCAVNPINLETIANPRHGKAVLVSIPSNEMELHLISVEPDADYFKITSKIRELLRDFKK